MPIYMDRHDLAVTAKDVAEAHREDVKIQDKYHCKGLTYWFDEQRGSAFCLVEAPNAECVKNMHDHAHGLVPHQIIEVESNVVSAFLGRITDPKPENILADADLPIINDSAYRIIMYISMREAMLLKSIVGQEKALQMINQARDSIQRSINRFSGSEVIKDNSKLIISFKLAEKAVRCALEIQQVVSASFQSTAFANLNIKIALNAGMPVSNQKSLFGETIQLAERLCEVSNQNQIVISSAVREMYNNENLDGLHNETQLQALNPDDEDFVNQLIETTETIWNDPKFEVGIFGKQVGLSRSQLYRKTSAITGLSPNEFIKEYRLKKALKLIETKKGNIAQITFETGFNSPSYFSKCFHKRYGVLPSNLVK